MNDIARHYARPGLAAAILDALARAGKDPERLAPEDLAPIDEFHVRGRAATLEFARAAERTQREGPPALSLALLFGAEFPAMIANLRRNLDEGRALLVQGVAAR